MLKIDKSFVDRVGAQEKAEKVEQLTQGIIELARTLGLEVVAEGIEREEQLLGLLALRCVSGSRGTSVRGRALRRRSTPVIGRPQRRDPPKRATMPALRQGTQSGRAILAPPAGLEPATRCLEGARSSSSRNQGYSYLVGDCSRQQADAQQSHRLEQLC